MIQDPGYWQGTKPELTWKGLQQWDTISHKEWTTSNYLKNPKNLVTRKKNCCNHTKIWRKWLYHRVMCPKDTDRIANTVDPDLALDCLHPTLDLGLHCLPHWSASTLFALLIWVYTVCPDLWDHFGSLLIVSRTLLGLGSDVRSYICGSHIGSLTLTV